MRRSQQQEVDPREAELEAQFERDATILIKQRKDNKVESFTGYFEFLKLEYPAKVLFNGVRHNSVAHAFAAARSQNDPLLQRRIQKAPTYADMLQLASLVQEPSNFSPLKVMEALLRDKFKRNNELRDRLQATQQRTLLNTLSGSATEEKLFWGHVGKHGQNNLGKLLEKVRLSINDDSDLDHWMSTCFDLVDGDRSAMPTITLDTHKDKQLIETITLENKAVFLFGRQPNNDVPLLHESISRHHAAFVIDKERGVMLVDLGSKAGTTLDGKPLDPYVPTSIPKRGAQVTFGMSSRVYQVQPDYSRMERAVVARQRYLEKEMEQLKKLDDVSGLDVDTLKSSLGIVRQDTLYVSNLPYHFEESDLQNLFSDCGKILSIRLPADRMTKKSKGFAFLTMENDRAAKKALNYNGHKIMDRTIRVTIAKNQDEDRTDRNHDNKIRSYRDSRDTSRRRKSRSRSRSYDRYRKSSGRRRRYSRSSSSSRDNRRHRRKKISYESPRHRSSSPPSAKKPQPQRMPSSANPSHKRKEKADADADVQVLSHSSFSSSSSSGFDND